MQNEHTDDRKTGYSDGEYVSPMRYIDVPAKTLERAWNEPMELEVTDEGHVRVRNLKYDDPDEHVYQVVMSGNSSDHPKNGVPMWCLKKTDDGWTDCPAMLHHCSRPPNPTDSEPHEACKHMTRAAGTKAIIVAVNIAKNGGI